MQDYLDRVEKQLRDAIDAEDVDAILRLGAILDEADRARAARLTSTGALASAATWYAEQGIAVFPLQPRGKLPATKHGFKDASTDLDQVRAWWTNIPEANIGVPTGGRFDVIDIDGLAGVSTWSKLKADNALPPVVGHVSTPRPGGNHLYVPASGLGNKAGVYPGVDYRGIGGYVVAPPSVGANGVAYRWIRHLELDPPRDADNTSERA